MGCSGNAGYFHIPGFPEALAKGVQPADIAELKSLAAANKGEFHDVEPLVPAQPITVNDPVVSVQAGGGGMGDPLDREPARVLTDVGRRIFSLEMAKEIFGVIIDPETNAVDEVATKKQREKIKATRRKSGKIWNKENKK